MKRLIAATAVGLFALLCGSTNIRADDTKPVTPKLERVEDKPDTAAGEVRKTKLVRGGALLSITTEYTDGRIKLQEYLDGQLIGEAEQLKGGGLKNSRFKDGKPFEVFIVQNGSIEHQEFRSDGKLWFKSVSDKAGARTSQYFGKDGVLRLTREIKKSGPMEVRVFDPKGKELYKQTWLPGIAGYVLSTVEENTPAGTRRVTVSGGKAVKAEYLNADGTINKTEDGDKLSEPFDPARANELDSQDDQTIPKSIR